MSHVKLRAQQIIIDTPKEGEDIWIHVAVQRIEKDDEGNTLNVSPRAEFIHKSMNDFVTSIYHLDDPVLGTDISISGAGVQMGITDAVLTWIADAFNGTREGVEVWLS